MEGQCRQQKMSIGTSNTKKINTPRAAVIVATMIQSRRRMPKLIVCLGAVLVSFVSGLRSTHHALQQRIALSVAPSAVVAQTRLCATTRLLHPTTQCGIKQVCLIPDRVHRTPHRVILRRRAEYRIQNIPPHESVIRARIKQNECEARQWLIHLNEY